MELTLFSPDTTDIERAWLRIWRAWPLAGIVPMLVTFIVIGAGGGLAAGTAAALILYAVGFGVFAQQTPNRSSRVVVLRGGIERRDGFDQQVGEVTRITTWAARLEAADSAFDLGAIDAAQRDEAWREAWAAVVE